MRLLLLAASEYSIGAAPSVCARPAALARASRVLADDTGLYHLWLAVVDGRGRSGALAAGPGPQSPGQCARAPHFSTSFFVMRQRPGVLSCLRTRVRQPHKTGPVTRGPSDGPSWLVEQRGFRFPGGKGIHLFKESARMHSGCRGACFRARVTNLQSSY